MCTYNITLNDSLVEKARPAFANDKALQKWLQEQVSAILERYVSSRIESESVHQHAMVEESLTTAFNELHSGQAKKNRAPASQRKPSTQRNLFLNPFGSQPALP